MALHRVIHRLAVRFPPLRGALDVGKEKRDRAGRACRTGGPESGWIAMQARFVFTGVPLRRASPLMAVACRLTVFRPSIKAVPRYAPFCDTWITRSRPMRDHGLTLRAERSRYCELPPDLLRDRFGAIEYRAKYAPDPLAIGNQSPAPSLRVWRRFAHRTLRASPR